MQIIPPTLPEYDEFGRPINKRIPTVPSMSGTSLPGNIPAPVIAPTGPTAQSIQPDFSPVHVQPAEATPTQQAIKNLVPPDPHDPALKQSRLRTVLNAIAAGFAGAAGGPRAGIDTAQSLSNQKY